MSPPPRLFVVAATHVQRLSYHLRTNHARSRVRQLRAATGWAPDVVVTKNHESI